MDFMRESFFIKTFGKSPRIRLLDFLIDNSLLDWSKSDMAEQTGISRATLDRFFDDLVKQRIILKSRDIGRARLYKLNKKLPLVQKLIELDYVLSRQSTGKIKVKVEL